MRLRPGMVLMCHGDGKYARAIRTVQRIEYRPFDLLYWSKAENYSHCAVVVADGGQILEVSPPEVRIVHWAETDYRVVDAWDIDRDGPGAERRIDAALEALLVHYGPGSRYDWSAVMTLGIVNCRRPYCSEAVRLFLETFYRRGMPRLHPKREERRPRVARPALGHGESLAEAPPFTTVHRLVAPLTGMLVKVGRLRG